MNTYNMCLSGCLDNFKIKRFCSKYEEAGSVCFPARIFILKIFLVFYKKVLDKVESICYNSLR